MHSWIEVHVALTTSYKKAGSLSVSPHCIFSRFLSSLSILWRKGAKDVIPECGAHAKGEIGVLVVVQCVMTPETFKQF